MESNKSIKSYYYISETFYNRNDDDISFKKIRILLQHLVGYKSDGDKFTSETITKYDKISFYDDDQGTLRLAIDINHLLRLMIGKTEEQVSESIKKIVKSSDCELVVNEVTPNINNRLIKTEVCLEYSNIIKTFESFSHRGRL
jgi:hypothetical protein